jgi:protein-S-isoprenylcysteine O-methyltransferase Ste14
MLLLKSIFFTFLFPGTVTILIPYLILRGNDTGGVFGTFNYLGLPLIAVGAFGLIWCIWQFFAEGLGTLAPVDPPKHLVVHGLYRYVRNPMYVSVMAILLGEAAFFASLPILVEAVIFFLATNFFIRGYEEPILREQFGDSYEEYKKSVGRWLPRWR